jgi:hypothetical protein
VLNRLIGCHIVECGPRGADRDEYRERLLAEINLPMVDIRDLAISISTSARRAVTEYAPEVDSVDGDESPAQPRDSGNRKFSRQAAKAQSRKAANRESDRSRFSLTAGVAASAFQRMSSLRAFLICGLAPWREICSSTWLFRRCFGKIDQ